MASLIIIYNADSTWRGKAAYAYRKLSSSKTDEPACGACDITHGGLSLNETPNWTHTKREIESQGFKVKQWHRDEVERDVKEWLTSKGVRYPVVIKQDGGLEVVADSSELAQCAGDATRLVEILRRKGVLSEGSKAEL